MIDLSVIIPLYNSEKTLFKCLNSIHSQVGISMEIILVDDESTDSTLRLCEEYCSTDVRIKVLHKRNGGVASARNAGLKVAQGDYVTFVDQDDWVEKDIYGSLLEQGRNMKADMIVYGYSKDWDDNSTDMLNRKKIKSVIECRDELLKYAFFREEYRGFAAFVWNKIFKREFLTANHIVFDETLRRGDDVLFFTKVAVRNPKSIYVDKVYYHYVQRSDSLTHTLTKENLGRLSEILSGYQKAIKIAEKNKVSTLSINYMKCFYVYHASTLFELSIKCGIRDSGNFYRNEMKKYYNEYCEQNKCYVERIKRINSLISLEN